MQVICTILLESSDAVNQELPDKLVIGIVGERYNGLILGLMTTSTRSWVREDLRNPEGAELHILGEASPR